MTVPWRYFFCYHFVIYVSCLYFLIILSCLFLATLWSRAGKGQTYWLSCVRCFFLVLLWCPGSGVVLDCIDS